MIAKYAINVLRSVLIMGATRANKGAASPFSEIISRKDSCFKYLFISYLLLTASSFATGEESSEFVRIPDFEVTGSRSNYLKESIPLSHRFISIGDISDQNAIGIEDLLARSPGIHIDRSSRSGGVGSLYLRGGDPNFVLTLVNGVKINDPTNDRGGSFDYASIDPFSLQGVEIVKGAQSALYGSEALSGVINLVTIDDSAPSEVRFLGEAGTDSFKQARFAAGESNGKLVSRVTANYLDIGDAIEGERLKSRRYTASALVTIDEDSKLRVFGLASNTDKTAFPDDSGGPLFSDIRDLDTRDIEDHALGISYIYHTKETTRFQIDASLYNRREKIDSPGVAPGLRDPFGIPPTISDNELDRYQLSAYGEFFNGDTTSFIVGASIESEESSVDYTLVFPWQTINDFSELDRETHSGFAEFDWQATENVTWQVGIRHDDIEGIDSETSFLSGLAYKFADSNSYLRVHYAEGFKKPSVFALTNPVVGNPILEPEDSQSFELAWETFLADDQTRFEMAFFDQTFENLVDFDSGPPPMLVNRGQVDTKGGEASISHAISDTLELQGSLSYADASIAGSSEELRHRPQWRGSVSAKWQANEKTSMYLTGTYVDRRLDSSIPTGDKRLGAFFRADLRIKYHINDSFEAWLAIDNLFDEDYQEAVGFLNPGRQARLAIGWKQ